MSTLLSHTMALALALVLLCTFTLLHAHPMTLNLVHSGGVFGHMMPVDSSGRDCNVTAAESGALACNGGVARVSITLLHVEYTFATSAVFAYVACCDVFRLALCLRHCSVRHSLQHSG